jgi:3-deoxy-D-arabino-heptulosonate 7-phosphate (DAHP) synthase
VVERVVRVSREYRILGRHKDDVCASEFEYNGIRFSQDNLHVFAGLCAVDTPQHVEMMMKTLRDNGQQCTRRGAYKPGTNPYSFQGHGRDCLPFVFELAGKYGIRVIAMEITHEDHITVQGVIAGANMVLVDFHPDPDKALVDGPQALLLREFRGFWKTSALHVKRMNAVARRPAAILLPEWNVVWERLTVSSVVFPIE